MFTFTVWTAVSTSPTWMSLTSTSDPPDPREFHAMTAFVDGTVVIFGGNTHVTGTYYAFNDVWLLDVTSADADWTKLSGSGDVPTARHGHTLTTLADGTVVMFGGANWDGGFSFNGCPSAAGDWYEWCLVATLCI